MFLHLVIVVEKLRECGLAGADGAAHADYADHIHVLLPLALSESKQFTISSLTSSLPYTQDSSTKEVNADLGDGFSPSHAFSQAHLFLVQ